MSKVTRVAIAGLGSRGKDFYAKSAKLHPDKMEIVAIADIDPEKVELVAKEYHVPKEACFLSAEEMLKQEKLADAMIIATQDRQHVGHATAALEKGYHLLLEKPVSPDLAECRELAKAAKRYDKKVVVCHVLRYTPIYQKVKELLDSGVIGEVVSIMAAENVGWFHQAHSFVRGNWANSEETSPMILQKCCHDMDLYPWLAGKTCESLTSYGDTYLFKKEKAPKGCAKRCLDGCGVREECPFDAEKIYLDNKVYGYRSGNRIWPLDVLVPSGPTEEQIMRAIQEGRFGQCVYHCNNNVVDHQVVNLRMTDGTTMSFTMCGFTPDISRYARFMGTKGELRVDMKEKAQDCEISIRKFASDMPVETIDVAALADDFSGHGGGDDRMVMEFIDMISGEKEESSYVTSLERSLESHYCALAAEYSRNHDGCPVKIKEFGKN
ncbi:Gfo/Idh/MocA family oxidoreductase [Lachnospiraceae bacterium WCA-9-b2]|uniref:Gfo/Idh/MocA family oxidoreductase n=1 Tax=Sporofaciens musculi TaxID=2681861 RepID=A0A7X3MK88_9FIRM|nr:Gfo/Idh/MocA family oxidoreductase [Sporofaciens musculi]MCI9421662.1 Gfo/Idh/MocA family oxidoreductase [Dorea sp.]MXP77974.1 Gfo/Idh/MocA family oxidoreductase [Sporofaciens musculi]